MKIAVFTLCVVLPSLCVCTPLPDYSVAANSDANSNVQSTGNGNNLSATSNSSSSAGVNVGAPPAVPPTVAATPPPTDTTTPPCSNTPTPATGGSTVVNANSNSNASINQQGSPTDGTTTKVDTNSNSNASINQQGSPTDGTTTEVDANSKSDAKVDQQGGPGGSVNVNASSSSSASASVAVSGNKCGKPDCDGFDKYSILVKNQGDIQKLTKVWMVWKSSSSTKVDVQEKICFARHLDDGCQSSQFRITAQSETEVFYESWGRTQEKVIYTKQKLSITSEKFHVYTSNVLTVTELDNGSQEVISVKNEQTIKQIFDNNVFGIVDTDYDSYVVCTTKGENSVTFIALSQQVYESQEMKQQVSQKVDKVLQTNNLSSTTFIEVTNKFDIDIDKYQWDKCSQGGNNSNNGSGNGSSVNANANSSSSVDVNQKGSPSGGSTDVDAKSNSSANVDVKNKDNNGTPGSTDVNAKSDSSANVDVKNKDNNGTPTTSTDVNAKSDSSANVNVKNKDNNGTPGSSTDVNANANSNANASVNGGSGNTGKPDVQGFTNYSVLKTSFEEFQTKINKITWHLAKYTASSEEVKTDVVVCADRYIKQCSKCKNVKFQYVLDKGCFVMKEWGLEENLIYIQEKITASSKDFVILKAEVENVMKATVDSDTAVSVGDDSQVKSSLSSEYAVLATDYQNFFIGQTSCDKGAITFIAFIEEVYLCEEKQQQFAAQISQVLKANGIDESKLQKLTEKFSVDTNKYNKTKVKTDVSDDGKSTTTKQETEQKDGNGKSCTETTVSNGPSPSGGSSTNVNASSSSNANVNINNNGGSPPCDNTPPASPPTTPPATPPTTPPATPPATPPTSVSANSSSNSNASVDTTGGNTALSANSSSDANAQVNGSP